MNRRGFSIVELMIVIMVLGVLVNLALPAVQHMRRRAQAVHVIGDFHAVRVAALDRYTADGGFPPLDAYGKVPPKLATGLPKGFAFQYGKVEYRWISVSLSNSDRDDDDDKKDKKKNGGSAPPQPQRVFAGLGVRGSKDAKLMAAIRAAYRGPTIFLSSTEFILMVE